MQKLVDAIDITKYLNMTVSNLVHERFRRAGTVEKFEVSEDLSEIGAADIAEDAAQTERRHILESVLGSLKPLQRSCLELHYLDGHTHSEIANLLGLPQDTVSSILRRAKEKLKERLRKKGLEDS